MNSKSKRAQAQAETPQDEVPPADDFAARVDAFILHLARERRASRHTTEAYRRDLTQLGAFLRQRFGRNVSVSDVNRLLIRAHFASQSATVTSTSLSRKLSALRSFFKYLERTGVVDENPVALIVSPKVRRKLPRFLGPEAAEHVMDAAHDDSTATNLRDCVILELLYGFWASGE
ncbi:MAG: site-specific integrase [Polyangiaceae bacterium]